MLSSALTLADVVPPRRVIFAGALGAACANALLLAAHGPETAIPLRVATGFFLAAVYPPALKLMATWFRKGRGTALGVLVGALTVGSALPYLVNGVGGVDWQPVIVVTSVAHRRRRRARPRWRARRAVSLPGAPSSTRARPV